MWHIKNALDPGRGGVRACHGPRKVRAGEVIADRVF